jgi:hypothetical protein
MVAGYRSSGSTELRASVKMRLWLCIKRIDLVQGPVLVDDRSITGSKITG